MIGGHCPDVARIEAFNIGVWFGATKANSNPAVYRGSCVLDRHGHIVGHRQNRPGIFVRKCIWPFRILCIPIDIEARHSRQMPFGEGVLGKRPRRAEQFLIAGYVGDP